MELKGLVLLLVCVWALIAVLILVWVFLVVEPPNRVVYVSEEASHNRNSSLCLSLLMDSDIDSCLLIVAKAGNDTRSCEKMAEPDKMDGCFMTLGATYRRPDACSKVASRTSRLGCYAAAMQGSYDAAGCKSLRDRQAWDECMNVSAFANRNPKTCALIADPDMKLSCSIALTPATTATTLRRPTTTSTPATPTTMAASTTTSLPQSPARIRTAD